MANKEQIEYVWDYKSQKGLSLGLLLLIIGFYWLARDIGWITTPVSTWSLIFIMLGLWLIVSRLLHGRK